ncbi:MAG: serine/threonine-protein kinase, partial [Planctomycetota bacterium]|nr:serine/threonine-protein kinase [Planctomycetota bacterium]
MVLDDDTPLPSPNMEKHAEECFQNWLDIFQEGAGSGVEEYIRSLPSELRGRVHEKVAEFFEMKKRLGGDGGSLKAGRVLDDYRLVKELGRGGSGVVWEAEQLSLKRRVAVKFLYPIYSLSPGALERFRREAEAAGRLVHPGIVQVYATGEAENHHFIVEELVLDGITLADVLAERMGAEPTAAYYSWLVRIFIQIANAVQVAHEAGVIHRDLKPGNILMTGDYPKVGDFGLARMDGGISLSFGHEAMGTLYYMSPEQIKDEGKGVDGRTDIYALGITLYEALTGFPPFQGTGREAIVHRILMEDPVPPRKVRAGIPRDLEIICLKAVRKQSFHRYASMADFAEDMKAWDCGESILAAPMTKVERGVRWCRRRPGASVAIAIIFLSSAILLFLALENIRVRKITEKALTGTENLLALLSPDLHPGQTIQYLSHQEEFAEFNLHQNPLLQARQFYSIGRAYRFLELWMPAKRCFERALKTSEGVTGIPLERLLDIKLELGWCLQRIGGRPKAREVLESVIESSQGESPRGALRQAHAWNRLGAYWLDQTDTERAFHCFRKTEVLLATHSSENMGLYLLNQLDLAIAYSLEEDFDRALPLLIETKQGFEDHFGPFHPEIPYCLIMMYSIHARNGEVAQAKYLGEQA